MTGLIYPNSAAYLSNIWGPPLMHPAYNFEAFPEGLPLDLGKTVLV